MRKARSALLSVIVLGLVPILIVMTPGTAQAATRYGTPLQAEVNLEASVLAGDWLDCGITFQWVVPDNSTFLSRPHIKMSAPACNDGFSFTQGQGWDCDSTDCTRLQVTLSGDGASETIGVDYTGGVEPRRFRGTNFYEIPMTALVDTLCVTYDGYANNYNDVTVGPVCQTFLLGPPPAQQQAPAAAVKTGSTDCGWAWAKATFVRCAVYSSTSGSIISNITHDGWLAAGAGCTGGNARANGIIYESKAWAPQTGVWQDLTEATNSRMTFGSCSVARADPGAIELARRAAGSADADMRVYKVERRIAATGFNGEQIRVSGSAVGRILVKALGSTTTDPGDWSAPMDTEPVTTINPDGSTTTTNPDGTTTTSPAPITDETSTAPADRAGSCEFSVLQPSTWLSGGMCRAVQLLGQVVSGVYTVVGAVGGVAGDVVAGVGSAFDASMTTLSNAIGTMFVPSPGYVDAKVNALSNDWKATQPGAWSTALTGQSFDLSGMSGCGGVPMNVTLPGGVEVSESIGKACSGKMESVASVARLVTSAMLVIFGGLACVRALGSGFGWDPGIARGGLAST